MRSVFMHVYKCGECTNQDGEVEWETNAKMRNKNDSDRQRWGISDKKECHKPLVQHPLGI